MKAMARQRSHSIEFKRQVTRVHCRGRACTRFPSGMISRISWFASGFRSMKPECPKLAAVLPHPSTFALEFASTLGNFQHARRQPGGPVFLGIKAREMLADDLARFITLEAPRA